MNKPLNMKRVERDRDLQGLRRLYYDIESLVQSLGNIDIEDDNPNLLVTMTILVYANHSGTTTLSVQVDDQ